jgi:Ohr subfamily peroxiredoxin
MIRKNRRGPLESANREIRAAIDRLAAEHRAASRLHALLERTDAMLAELETLNLMEVWRIPEALRSDLMALIANLPFEFPPSMRPNPSPTAAIDMLFDIQERLFRTMGGPEVDTETDKESAVATIPLDLDSLGILLPVAGPRYPGGLHTTWSQMKILYTAEAVVQGGRRGHGRTRDGRLAVDLALPKEMDGDGGPGTNPEQLFAVGYAACFQSALLAAAQSRKLDTSESVIRSRVGIGPVEVRGLGLAVAIDLHAPHLARAEAEELMLRAHERCPYSRAIRGNVEVTLTVDGASLQVK